MDGGRLRRIDALLAASRPADALRLVDEGLVEDPDDLFLLLRRAQGLRALGRTDDALEASRRVIAVAPDHPSGHTLLGDLLLTLGRTREARQALLRARAADAERLDAAYFLAWLEATSGDTARARDLADELLARWPDQSEAHHADGVTARAEKRWDAAEAAFRRALALDPEDPHLLNDLGRLLVKRRRRAEGVQLLQAAAEADLESKGRRREALAAVPQADEAGLGITLLVGVGLLLLLLCRLFDWPWAWSTIDAEVKATAILGVILAAFHSVSLWRRRRLALPERTERFLQTAEQEEAEPAAFGFLLSLVPITLGVWWLLLFTWVASPAPAASPESSLGLALGVTTVGLLALAPFVRLWLRHLPEAAGNVLAWDLAAVSCGVPWVRLLLWIWEGSHSLTTPWVLAVLAVTTVGVVVTWPITLRKNLHLERAIRR